MFLQPYFLLWLSWAFPHTSDAALAGSSWADGGALHRRRGGWGGTGDGGRHKQILAIRTAVLLVTSGQPTLVHGTTPTFHFMKFLYEVRESSSNVSPSSTQSSNCTNWRYKRRAGHIFLTYGAQLEGKTRSKAQPRQNIICRRVHEGVGGFKSNPTKLLHFLLTYMNTYIYITTYKYLYW